MIENRLQYINLLALFLFLALVRCVSLNTINTQTKIDNSNLGNEDSLLSSIISSFFIEISFRHLCYSIKDF